MVAVTTRVVVIELLILLDVDDLVSEVIEFEVVLLLFVMAVLIAVALEEADDDAKEVEDEKAVEER
jgi:hypothetical protein